MFFFIERAVKALGCDLPKIALVKQDLWPPSLLTQVSPFKGNSWVTFLSLTIKSKLLF